MVTRKQKRDQGSVTKAVRPPIDRRKAARGGREGSLGALKESEARRKVTNCSFIQRKGKKDTKTLEKKSGKLKKKGKQGRNP